ncbi:hypothetical protein ACFU8Q_23475 [Streptomyces sp. NPDC057543]|uniref:hypothetical protein n=1 Tax=Streptomyces sp. NPDC057543 TaxID=3346163 RepID=UPI0036BB394F
MATDQPPRAAVRSYGGEGIAVSYDAHRCLRATECVRGLSSVFDVGLRRARVNAARRAGRGAPYE